MCVHLLSEAAKACWPMARALHWRKSDSDLFANFAEELVYGTTCPFTWVMNAYCGADEEEEVIDPAADANVPV